MLADMCIQPSLYLGCQGVHFALQGLGQISQKSKVEMEAQVRIGPEDADERLARKGGTAGPHVLCHRCQHCFGAYILYICQHF